MVKTRNLLRMMPKRFIALLILSIFLIAGLGTPTILCRSGLAARILQKALTTPELPIEVSSVDAGWLTPTQIKNFSVGTASGDYLRIESLACDLSIFEWLTLDPAESIELYARKAKLNAKIKDGKICFLNDLQQLKSDTNTGSKSQYLLDIKEISLMLDEQESGKTWQLDQANAAISYTESSVTIDLEGVVTDPGEQNGSLRCTAAYTPAKESKVIGKLNEKDSWSILLNLDSLPLSCSQLITPYLADSQVELARFIEGDATGEFKVSSVGSHESRISFSNLQLRKVKALDPALGEWQQQLSEINGDITLSENGVSTEGLSLSSDFGHIAIDGQIEPPKSKQSLMKFIRGAVVALNGSIELDIDLPIFWKSASDFLPFKQGTEVVSGRVHGQIQTDHSTRPIATTLQVMLENFQATTETGKSISLAPNSLTAKIETDDTYLRANSLEWKSEFGSAYFQGDLQDGSGAFEIDFSKITQSLSQFLMIDEGALSGTSEGEIRWTASDSDQWSLNGSFDADSVVLRVGNLPKLKQKQINGTINAKGIWGSEGLEALRQLNAAIDLDDIRVSCELSPGEHKLSSKEQVGVHWSSQGKLSSFNQVLKHLSIRGINAIGGNYVFEADSLISGSEIEITQSAGEITNFVSQFNEISFQQPLMQVAIAGQYDLSNDHYHIHDFTLSSHSISARAKGERTADTAEYELQWRTLLDRLSTSFAQQLDYPQSGSGNGDEIANSDRLSDAIENLQLRGDVQGTLSAKRAVDSSQYEIDMQVSDLSIPHVGTKPASNQNVNGGSKGGLQNGSDSGWWIEPRTRVLAILRVPNQDEEIRFDQLDISTDWIQTSLQGQLATTEMDHRLSLAGTSTWNMDRLNKRLTSMAPVDLVLNGTHQSDVSLNSVLSVDGLNTFQITTDVGWDSARIAGVELASASIPIRVDQNQITFHGSKLPVGEGWIDLNGSIQQLNQETWIELTPSRIAEGIQITPEMSEQWLRFIAPLLADATKIDGNLGISVDEARINISDPTKTRLSGRLELDTVRLVAGPFMNQLIQTLQQLKKIGRDPSQILRTDPSTLIKLPTQTVAFGVANQIVAHERLLIDVDRAQLITTGQVSFEGNLNLTTAIPLDEKWIGKDLQRLAGQTLYLPIQGTLERPSLDRENLQDLLTQLGIQAIQRNAENYIEDQINRGLDKLFGK